MTTNEETKKLGLKGFSGRLRPGSRPIFAPQPIGENFRNLREHARVSIVTLDHALSASRISWRMSAILKHRQPTAVCPILTMDYNDPGVDQEER